MGRSSIKLPSDGRAPSVPSIARLLDLIGYFAEIQKPSTLSTIATALELPKSSCFAILETLEAKGYLYQVAPRMGYYPTRRWLELFVTIGQADPLRERVHAVMERLHEKTGETLLFARRTDTRVVYLDVIESRESIRYAAQIGQLRPLHATASGKAILSFLPPAERRRLLSRSKRVALTSRTITNVSALEAEIVKGIARGWHLTDGETEPEVTGISVCTPIMNEPYAVVVAGPSFRLASRKREVGALLVAACAKLSVQ